MLRGRYLPGISLANKHRLTLSQHNYIFFDDKRVKNATVYQFLSYNLKQLTRPLMFSLMF